MPQVSPAQRSPTGQMPRVAEAGRVSPPSVSTRSRLSERTTITVEVNVAQVVRAILVGVAAVAAALGAPKLVQSVTSADIRITISSQSPAVKQSAAAGVSTTPHTSNAPSASAH
jgi:hypothetical protein